MLRNAQQNSQFHAIVSKLKLTKEMKTELVLSFSGGRTQSSAELTVDEMRNLIAKLNVMQHRPMDANFRVNFYNEDPADKMRKKCLSIAHELGWEYENGTVNMPLFNAWLFKFGYLHKAFNNYTYDELPKLVTQLENLLKTDYARAGKASN